MCLLKVFLVFLCVTAISSKQIRNVCEGQDDYWQLNPQDPCTCYCYDELLHCPPCTTSTTESSTGDYCEGKDDHTINPLDPCSCMCINGWTECPGCTTTTEDPCIEQPTTKHGKGHNGYTIDPEYPPPTPCPSSTTDISTSTPASTTGEYCEGMPDHTINPSDPCSCMCLGGWLACPTCFPPTEPPTGPTTE